MTASEKDRIPTIDISALVNLPWSDATTTGLAKATADSSTKSATASTIDSTDSAAADSSTTAAGAAAAALTAACRRFGCASLTNHGVPRAVVDEAFDWSRRLFALSRADKARAPHPKEPIPHRGYSGVGLEKVYAKELLDQDGSRDVIGDAEGEDVNKRKMKVHDYKESFDIGAEDNVRHQGNIWLPEEVLPGFRDFALSFYWRLHELARAIARGFGIGLGLKGTDLTAFVNIFTGNNNQLRFLHYPEITSASIPELTSRIAPHCDWSGFTFLFQDACGGLELEDPKRPGVFLPAMPHGDDLVLNAGDMLQRLSNEILVLHYVPQPRSFKIITQDIEARSPVPKSNNGESTDTGNNLPGTFGHQQVIPERYSIPYFVAPDDTAVVAPLETLIDAEHPAMYEPVVFQEYSGWRGKLSYGQ